ncbi:ATP-binding protein [uncultured Alistipes sp.]|uniref:ATP-binding protein n=1 Tax=uncultured Alistipes sp. TaxID=538949 RepID=UPI00272D3CFB|nr:ATP-binding protein [uncultured Alistipes sp.]
MERAISNKNMMNAKFEVADFTGKWLASIGKPELRGAWIIYGESGCGKTHFALELLKYLCGFVGRTAYDTVEQGKCRSFQNAWKDAAMHEVGTRVIVLHKEQIKELRERLQKRKSPNVIVIDSITALIGFTRAVFIELINEFPDKLFIFIAHEENNKPYPAIAQHVRKLSEVKVRVEGFRAFVTTRFKTAEGGGEDFTIWDEGAAEYWASKL